MRRAKSALSPGRAGLLLNRNFRLLWIGETSSKIGTAVTGVALPLVATVTLHASAFEIGLIVAGQWVPWLIVGLPAGAWVDRLSPRRLMIWCNVVSALSVVSIPVANAAGVLTVAQILVVAPALGLANVFFSTAYLVYLPLIVTDNELVAANTRLQGSESSAQIAGPSLGGVLAAAFGAAAGLLVDSVSFVVSTFCLLLAHEPKGRPQPPLPSGQPAGGSIWREVREGLAFVWHSPILRLFTVVAALANMTMTAYEAILVVFLVRTVHLSFLAIGLLMATTGIGGVLGAFAAGSLVRRLGDVRTILLSMAATGPFGLLIPLTSRGWAVLFFALGSTVPVSGLIIFNIVISSFRQQQSPRHLLGRISATMRFLLFGAIPVGAVIGGALGSALGLRNALWWIMSAAVLPGLILVASPIRRTRELSLEATAEDAELADEADLADDAADN